MNDVNDERLLVIGFGVGIVFGVFIGIVATCYLSQSWWEREAVRKGAAVYAVEGGIPVWQWKDASKNGSTED